MKVPYSCFHTPESKGAATVYTVYGVWLITQLYSSYGSLTLDIRFIRHNWRTFVNTILDTSFCIFVIRCLWASHCSLESVWEDREDSLLFQERLIVYMLVRTTADRTDTQGGPTAFTVSSKRGWDRISLVKFQISLAVWQIQGCFFEKNLDILDLSTWREKSVCSISFKTCRLSSEKQALLQIFQRDSKCVCLKCLV